jgi:hypothetical protein
MPNKRRTGDELEGESSDDASKATSSKASATSSKSTTTNSKKKTFPSSKTFPSNNNSSSSLSSSPQFMQKLESLYHEVFTNRSIQIGETKVIPVPLFKILNGKTPGDYVQRVEPSIAGGKKLGKFLWNYIKQELAGEALTEVLEGR